MKTSEIIVFIVYLLCMLGIGIFFFVKKSETAEKMTYFLGGREMGPWVAALSAGASDMSAWVLMGLPTSIYALGLGQVWIPVGLAIGYTISWLLEAPRLRKFLDCSKRLNHHSAVSDQQIPVQITCTAGDMCNCVFWLHTLFMRHQA